ncbi:MAG: hypothetical protein FJ278_17190, partial [Planctomycetes bacterium]|nr:hypothetical protein [Planctomycetota bacterium]
MTMAVKRTLTWYGVLTVTLLVAIAFGGIAVKVNNADFEKADATGNAPEGWTYVTPQNGDGALSLDAGREGGKCAKVTCTRHEGIWGPGMGQLGVVTVEKGKWYELGFWARAEGLAAGAIAALRDITDWNANQIYEQFHPARSWGKFSMKFRATKDLPAANSRLQFHFDSTGILWIDDVTLAETEPPKPDNVLDVAGRKNLLPNSSFECGAFGWGTYGADELFGTVDASTAVHGRQSFRIHLA